jgi:lysophospholipase L1-like esterase
LAHNAVTMKHLLKHVFFSALLPSLVVLALVPCARAADLGNIWPLGDSITYGQGAAGGYRETLCTNLTARGYSFNLVGTLTSNPSTLLSATGQTHHDGHSGYSITNATDISGTSRSGLYEGVVSWHGSINTPNVILLLIGINDLNIGYKVDTAPARLDLLVTRLFGYFPNTRLLIASLPDADQNNPYRHSATNDLAAAVSNYNAGIVSLVASHRAMGQKIAFVDLHAGLTLADLGDGLHPSAAGYVKMGNIWADAVVADPPKFTSPAISVSGGVVTLTASGAMHTSYAIQASTNLAGGTWTLVTNGNISASPFLIRLADTNNQRFYSFSAP